MALCQINPVVGATTDRLKKAICASQQQSTEKELKRLGYSSASCRRPFVGWEKTRKKRGNLQPSLDTDPLTRSALRESGHRDGPHRVEKGPAGTWPVAARKMVYTNCCCLCIQRDISVLLGELFSWETGFTFPLETKNRSLLSRQLNHKHLSNFSALVFNFSLRFHYHSKSLSFCNFFFFFLTGICRPHSDLSVHCFFSVQFLFVAFISFIFSLWANSTVGLLITKIKRSK